MKKYITLLAVASLALIAYSCNKNKDTKTTTAYLDLPATPYNYQSAGWDPKINEKATLGRVLFYDTHLSINNAISCGSCHKQALGFADNTALSAGFEGRLTKRNTIALNSGSFFGALFWDGRENNINSLSLKPITNHVEMGMDNLDKLNEKLAALPYYKALFESAWGDGEITAERISSSLGSFMTSITPGITRFDWYKSGNETAMTATEIEGMHLFDTKYNCASCHAGGGGGYGGSGSFKDIGLDFVYADKGLGALTGQTRDEGTFRVPNLSNVALTAPYMHDGRYKSLGDVLDHYSHGIRNSPNLDTLLKDGNNARVMNISDHEKECIVAFLGTLTDYTMITDDKFSNPFKTK